MAELSGSYGFIGMSQGYPTDYRFGTDGIPNGFELAEEDSQGVYSLCQ